MAPVFIGSNNMTIFHYKPPHRKVHIKINYWQVHYVHIIILNCKDYAMKVMDTYAENSYEDFNDFSTH